MEDTRKKSKIVINRVPRSRQNGTRRAGKALSIQEAHSDSAIQYTLGRFVQVIQQHTGQTTQTTHQTLVTVNTVPIEVSIVDTEGDLFDFRDCDAVIFVFSTISKRSFDVIEGLTDWITQLHRSGCLFALVGTKTDLDPQKVSFEEGSSLAQIMGAEYFHISVKNLERAELPFTSLLNRFVQPQPDQRIQTAIEKLSSSALWNWLPFAFCWTPRKSQTPVYVADKADTQSPVKSLIVAFPLAEEAFQRSMMTTSFALTPILIACNRARIIPLRAKRGPPLRH
jgi:hypothetical protein